MASTLLSGIGALKNRPYERCDALEEPSGSPNARRPLKKELAEVLGTEPTREVLYALAADGRLDASRISMNSFNTFREDFEGLLCGLARAD